MAKAKRQFTCTECGAIANKWMGQCPDCQRWNTMVETLLEAATTSSRFHGYAGERSQVQRLGEVAPSQKTRVSTGLSELDRVLGGGLVSGSVILIGGDPGIGKSTLLLQCLGHLSQQYQTLYVTGEESAEQVSLRAARLQLDKDNLLLLTETQIEHILSTAKTLAPSVMVVDSIQTIFTEHLGSAPGGVAQVRESAAQLVRFAKQTQTAVFVVGHVTKDGALAGPRVLEHMVDTVLYFEGQEDSRYRVIRAVKNRFGAVNELGVFAMTETGLKEVKNPSAIFLSRYQDPVAGSAVTATWEGSRPLLVEVQALVDQSSLANPRRLALGLDATRLGMLLAVLHRHGGVACHDQDVFVNVVGGVRVAETSADLALLLAVVSSLRDRPLRDRLVVFGEVGLAGEVRPVPFGVERLREAAKLGFSQAIVPAANVPKKQLEGITVQGVQFVSDALQHAFD